MYKQPVISDEGLRIEKEYQQKKNMSPIQRLDKCVSFRHHVFPQIEIFVFFKKPKIDDLKKLKFSSGEIVKYVNHKHYKDDNVHGRCVGDKPNKKIIISVHNYSILLPVSVSTLSHECTHGAHRLFEWYDINFTEEALCTLSGDLMELALTTPGCVPMRDADLIWNSVIILTGNDEIRSN